MSTDDYTLQLDTSQYQQSMSQANAITQQFTGSLSSLTQGSKTLQLGLLAVVPGVALLTKGFGGFAASAAAMEQSMSGLRATAAVSGQDIGKLTNSALALARSLPIGNQAAIQLTSQLQNLGITGSGSEDKINSLSKTMVNLAGATGSSVGAITQSMVQVSRAFGDQNLDPKRIGKFGDSLTTLQAKFGGSAEGILAFTKQIAPFARQAGIGESATMGIAAAFSKLGDDGSSAGITVNKILSDINKSVRDGTPQIFAYASIVGKTADQFRSLAKANPAEALTQVVEALGNGVAGQRALEQLGFGDSVRTARSLASLSQGGQLRSAIATSIAGFNSGSTQTGAKEAFSGLNDSLTKLQATSEQAAAALGAPFLQPLTGAAEGLNTVAGVFNAFAGSGVMQNLAKIVADVGLALIAYKSVSLLGSGGMAARLATNNLPVTLSRAGKLVAEAGGSEETALANAQRRAASTGFFGRADAEGRRGQRDLRALNARQTYLNTPEDQRSGYQNFAYGAGEYKQETTRIAQDRHQARINAAFQMYGPSPQLPSVLERIERENNRSGLNNAARRIGRFGLGSTRTVAEAYGRYHDQLYRMADAQENNPMGTFKDSGPQGTLKQPLQDLKDAAAGKGPAGGAAQGLKNLTGRLKDMTDVSIQTAKAVRTAHAEESIRTQALNTAAGLSAAPRARLLSADSAALKGLRAVGGGLLDAAGGLPGLAVMGGLALGGAAYSSWRGSQDQFKAQQSAMRNMSSTGTLDDYRDSIGKATGTTQTIADSVITVNKAMNAAVDSIARAKDLTPEDMNRAQGMRSALVHHFVGSDSQIASQVSGLQAGGLGPQELQSVKMDLYRQYGQDRTKSILGLVDTSGNALAGSGGGTGEITNKYASDVAGAAVHSYNTSKTGRSFMQWMGQGVWDKHGHVGNTTKGILDASVQGMVQQATAQQGSFNAAYARQEELKNADKIVSNLIKQGASDDVIKYTTSALSTALGGGGGEFDGSDLQHSSFSQLLASRGSKDYKQQLANFQSSGNFGTLTPTAQLGTTGMAVAGIKGYGSLFDNRQSGSLTNLVNSVTSGDKVGDATTQSQATLALVNASTKLGNSLSDTADKAAKAAAALGDTGTAADLNNAVRAKALEMQGYQDALGGGQAGIAHLMRKAQDDAANTDVTPSGQTRRDASKDEAFQALTAQKDMYSSRIMQNLQFNLQMTRMNDDHTKQLKYQQDDFKTQTVANEHDRLINVARANLNYQEQTQKSDHDFYQSRLRQQQDFARSIARGAEDAAKAMFDPYKRIATEALWDGRSLIQNLEEQTKGARQQVADLAQARKMGLTAQSIEHLGLADASHAQEIHALVADAGQDPNLIRDLNKSVAGKAGATTALYNDAGNVSLKRAKEDQARVSAQSLKDYKFNMAFSRAMFTQQGVQSTQDFMRQNSRMLTAFNLSLTRAADAYATQQKRMNEDLILSQTTMDGSLAKLQEIAHKGLKASAEDFASVMHDTMSSVEAEIAKAQVNTSALATSLLNGSLGTLQLQGHDVAPQYIPIGSNASSSDQNFWSQFENTQAGTTTTNQRSGTAGSISSSSLLFPGGLTAHANGGIMQRPHLGWIGEAGPEAVIPLNQRGVHVLADALSQAMKVMYSTPGMAMSHSSSSSHSYDHSTKVMGPVTVVAQDPNEMGAQLAERARNRNLTAAPVRRH